MCCIWPGGLWSCSQIALAALIALKFGLAKNCFSSSVRLLFVSATLSQHKRHCPPDASQTRLQVIYPDVQKRIIERARKRRLRLTVLKSLANTATPFGTLLLAEGGLNLDVADHLFDNFDKDNSNSIDSGACAGVSTQEVPGQLECTEMITCMKQMTVVQRACGNTSELAQPSDRSLSHMPANLTMCLPLCMMRYRYLHGNDL